MSICESPFELIDSTSTDSLIIDKNKKYINDYEICMNNKLNNIQGKIDNIVSQKQLYNDEIITAEQVNNDTMDLYINDYYYIIIKSILYLIILGGFIYLFGINNLIERIKITSTVVKDKTINVKNKAIELKNKAIELKDKIMDEKENIIKN